MSRRGTELLDGYLIMAHGSSSREIAARHDPPSRFLSMSDATVCKAYTAQQALAGKTDNPSDIRRTTMLQQKARERMLGRDPWDPHTTAAPQILKTVTPRVTPAAAMAAVPAATTTAAARFEPATGASLDASRRMTSISAGAGAGPSHGRTTAFTQEFNRGFAGR